MQISPDGLVRLSLDAILCVRLIPLTSGIDLDDCSPTRDCGSHTTISGYTEWVSASEPVISIGWDWTIDLRHGQPRWFRLGPPRSNVMLVDGVARDIGWHQNLQLLGTVVDALPWIEEAQKAVGMH